MPCGKLQPRVRGHRKGREINKKYLNQVISFSMTSYDMIINIRFGEDFFLLTHPLFFFKAKLFHTETRIQNSFNWDSREVCGQIDQ